MPIQSKGAGTRYLKKFLKDLKKNHLEVGWFEGANYDDGIPVAYVASIHEYGYEPKNIPPRSFMLPAQMKNGKEWVKLFGQITHDASYGKITAVQGLDVIGGTATQDVKDAIKDIKEPDIEQATKDARAKKGYNTTDILIASGTMFRTLNWVVYES